MGDASDSSHAPSNAMDYAEHNRTYDVFITGAKWGTGIVVVILVLMAIFLL